VAEWYFGVDDDLKTTEYKLAFHMQIKALENEPKNILFEWAVKFSLNDPVANYLAKQILLYENDSLRWLNTKGFPGKCIIESLEWSKNKWRG